MLIDDADLLDSQSKMHLEHQNAIFTSIKKLKAHSNINLPSSQTEKNYFLMCRKPEEESAIHFNFLQKMLILTAKKCSLVAEKNDETVFGLQKDKKVT